MEPNGDELDGTGGEDDFCPQNANWLDHAGCPLSDPGEEGGDLELTGEREIEDHEGGHPNPPMQQNRMHVTA